MLVNGRIDSGARFELGDEMARLTLSCSGVFTEKRADLHA